MINYEEIKSEYLGTDITLRELGIKYKTCRKALSKKFKIDGVNIRNRYHDSKLKYSFQEIDTEEQAYWLGFIFSDGSVICGKQRNGEYKYALEIGLQEGDLNHLEKFKSFMQVPTKKIALRAETKSCRIVYYSKELAENLVRLGIIQNKTYLGDLKKVLPHIPRVLQKHFIRGFFDGDGHFLGKTLGFTSYSPATLKQVHELLPISSPYKFYQKNKTSPTSSSRYKVKDSLTISNYLYQGSSIFLDRKYTHYLQKIAV